MIKEPFLSFRPSHFVVNPFIKAFIVSETLLWSSWNFIFPIIAIFIVSEVQGGSVEVAASAYSVYLFTRVVMELLCGRYLNKVGERSKLMAIIIGISILCLAFLWLISVSSIFMLIFAYVLVGIGLGISTPSKLALFSKHLDPGRVSTEWSLYDAFPFAGMAMAGIIGGLIVKYWGFDFVFLAAAFVNLAGIFPYYYVYKHGQKLKTD